MRIPFRSQLRRIRKEIVPGYSVSLGDVALFRSRLIGVASPLNLYGRWRKLLSHLVPDSVASAAGLESMREMYPGKFDRQIFVIQAFENLIKRGVEGAIVEFGTFRGHTAIQIVEARDRLNDAGPVYLFDSFAGFPPSEDPSDTFWKPGDLKSDYDEVSRRFSRCKDVKLIKGFFSDTLPGFPDIAVKFAHVDADMYTSTRDVNQWLLDRVVPGGIVIYDDYGFANCEGAKRAVDEAMAARRDYFTLSLPTGQYIGLKTA